MNQPELFGMVHTNDPQTSSEAARQIKRQRGSIQQKVLEAFTTNGNMTDEQLERLPQFQHYGPSTIRKRRSELYQDGKLKQVGKVPNRRGINMVVWGLV